MRDEDSQDIVVVHLGVEPYSAAEDLQERLVVGRQEGRIGDLLLLLEHEPVITLGRRGDPRHILTPLDVLSREGIDVRRTERGGDVTYHGPGQLVGYPIVHLPSRGLGASDYMHRLEDVIAATLQDFGIPTHRRQGIIGVWVGENKIAALGVRVKRGVAYHGFALNVAPNMAHWAHIVPCGLRDGGVTSMRGELGQAPPMSVVRDRVVHHFGRLFGARMRCSDLKSLLDAAGREPSHTGRERLGGSGQTATVKSRKESTR